MQSGPKWAIAATLGMILVVGGDVLYIRHKRTVEANAPLPATADADTAGTDPDSLVYLKREQPDTFKDALALKGKPLWVHAASQFDFYAVAGHHIDFNGSKGLLLGAQKIIVDDATEQPVPARIAKRILQGDKQVWLEFHFATPGPDAPAGEYATPVGYEQGGNYTYATDDIFFYDDPHVLYSAWGPTVWAAIDRHQVQPGMTEHQAELAVGQLKYPQDGKPGDRVVQYLNGTHPVTVTFAHGKATKISNG